MNIGCVDTFPEGSGAMIGLLAIACPSLGFKDHSSSSDVEALIIICF